MALLHPAPATPLPAGHHRQSTGVLLHRPFRRRFRLNAEKKPGSTSPRTGTPSGSESDNVVLKAAWYGSEVLGIAASFFRPPSPEADAGATDDGASESQPIGRAQVAEAIKDDFARSYFVTGNLTLGAYEDDCEFADPAGSFRGLRRFKRTCTNFGSLLEKSNMKLTKWQDVEIQSAINDGRLNFSEMQVDKQPFPMNTMDLEGKKMLIRPEVAESANKSNVVIGEPRKSKEGNKVLGRQVVLDKQPDGKEVIKITIKNSTLKGQPQVQQDTCVKFVKPKSPEVGKWKKNEAKVQHKRINPTFDTLFGMFQIPLEHPNLDPK